MRLLNKARLRSYPVIGILLACSIFVSNAGAEEIDARGAIRGKGLVNTDQGAVVIDGRVDFDVDIGPFTFGGAYRAYDTGNDDYNPAGIEPVHDLKHRYVEVSHSGLLVRGGHYFSTFGRGLTLRSFEDIDLEHDTALDGFIAEYDAAGLMITGLAGRLREDLSGMQYREHRLRGGRIRVEPRDWVALAASGLSRSSKRYDEEMPLPESISKFDDEIFGGELEMWAGPLVFAGEYAWREGGYYPLLRQGDVEGRGTYLSANVSIDRLVLLGEYKDYERIENELTSPPICVKEHVWTLMNRVTHQVDFSDERGFLVEGILSAPGDLQVAGGASEARTQDGGLMHWEVFAQVDQTLPRWGIRSFAGSWSREYVAGRFTEYMSGAIDFEFDIGSDQIVEIGLEAQSTEEPSGDSHEDFLASLTLYPGSGVTLSVSGESTTFESEKRDAWVFGEIRVEFAEDLEVALGGGTERGGKKCSGGICFTEPEFAGVRIRLSTFF
jgi:hypothetical protein